MRASIERRNGAKHDRPVRHQFFRLLARVAAGPRSDRNREWIDAFNAIVDNEGRERATFILRKLLDHARTQRVPLPPVLNTPYCNTIPLADQPQFAGNLELEAAIERTGALERAGHGGARQPRPTRNSVVTSPPMRRRADLFEVGFNHFFRAGQAGDLIFFQPHSAPGVYARAFLEGRLSEEQSR